MFNRRNYLKMAGATAALAATGLASPAAANPSGYDPDSVVDLGEKGLSNGDVIDSYLDKYFDNGVEVRIPEGEYNWRGSGFGSNAYRNAGVVGEGEVILNTSAGRFYENIRARGGALVFKNMTVRGTVTSSRVRLETDSSGHILVANWNFPDGAETDDRSRAFYAPRDHAGELELRNCYVKSFSDNGIYANSPGYDGAAGGRVVVDGCVAHNNNISGIRVGSDNSVVRNCVVINDGRSPSATTGRNQRGIWIRSGGDGVKIENCDVIHTYSGAGAPINFARDGLYGSGHIEGVRIRNDTSTHPCNAPSAWSGNDIHLTGSGDLRTPSQFTNVCRGSECDEPTRETDQDAGDSGSGSEDTAGVELVLETTDSDGIQYEFTASGEITPLTYRSEYNANAGDDVAEENDDGSWTATGATAGGSAHSGDSFRYEGDLLAFDVEGDVDSLTVYADGDVVNPDDLVVEEGNGDGEETTDGSSDSDGGSGDSSGDTTDSGSSDDGSTDDGSSDSGSSDEEELSNRLIIDGTNTDTVSSYQVHVTGQIELDASSSSTVDGGTPWDELDDVVDESTVTGLVGKGIDGYNYSGSITELNVEGSVEITLENNDL